VVTAELENDESPWTEEICASLYEHDASDIGTLGAAQVVASNERDNLQKEPAHNVLQANNEAKDAIPEVTTAVGAKGARLKKRKRGDDLKEKKYHMKQIRAAIKKIRRQQDRRERGIQKKHRKSELPEMELMKLYPKDKKDLKHKKDKKNKKKNPQKKDSPNKKKDPKRKLSKFKNKLAQSYREKGVARAPINLPEATEIVKSRAEDKNKGPKDKKKGEMKKDPKRENGTPKKKKSPKHKLSKLKHKLAQSRRQKGVFETATLVGLPEVAIWTSHAKDKKNDPKAKKEPKEKKKEAKKKNPPKKKNDPKDRVKNSRKQSQSQHEASRSKAISADHLRQMRSFVDARKRGTLVQTQKKKAGRNKVKGKLSNKEGNNMGSSEGKQKGGLAKSGQPGAEAQTINLNSTDTFPLRHGGDEQHVDMEIGAERFAHASSA
jgi:hypothetical protein